MCIAFSAIFYRYSHVSPSTATVFRCLFGLPVLAGVAVVERRRYGALPAATVGLAAAAGILFAGDLIAWHHAIEAVGAGLATVLGNLQVLVVGVVLAGAFLGVNNTLITETVMKAAPVERPVASAAYSFVRFSGAALAPWLAGVLGEQISVHLPFWVGAAAVLLGAGVLFATRKYLVGIDVEESELDEIKPSPRGWRYLEKTRRSPRKPSVSMSRSRMCRH